MSTIAEHRVKQPAICPWCGYPGHRGACRKNLLKASAELDKAVAAYLQNPDPSAGYDLSTEEAELVEWLWPGHIPLGKLTVFDGDPGLGKSTMALDIGARVTTGREMPDGSPGGPPAYVVILTAEDGIADTVRPRADAAGADCGRIRIIEDLPDPDGDHTPSIPGDIGALEQTIRNLGAKLVIIDPLSALGFKGSLQHLL